jgi:hypothetical protein
MRNLIGPSVPAASNRLISDMAMLATVIAFFFLSTFGFAGNFIGSVVAILDGDTPEVLHNYTPNVSALAH